MDSTSRDEKRIKANAAQNKYFLTPLDDASLSRLLEIVANVKKTRTKAQFNVIDELHADENAHTRILASLLKVDHVRRSFLQMIKRELHKIGNEDILSDDAICHTESEEVKVFSQYVDAQIVHQVPGGTESFAIIIENKIKGAIDQDKQLERYIETIKETYQIGTKRIIVLYLTLNGEKDAPESSITHETKKKVLYVPLSYKANIMPWLDKQLCFSLDQIQNEPYLSSGITQYVHHLKGLVNERPTADVFDEKLADVVGKALGDINPYLALSRVDYELGCYVSGGFLSKYSVDNYTRALFRKWLRRKFYWAFRMVVADDDNGTSVELDGVPYALAMHNTYEGQPGDLLYVDFFYEHGDVSKYKHCLAEFKRKLDQGNGKKICHWDELTYNEQDYTRVFISSENDLDVLLDALPRKVMGRQAQGRDSSSPRAVISYRYDLECLVKLQKALEGHVKKLDDNAAQRFSDQQRSTHYAYRNGWAWQRSPWNAYGEAEVQVFPRNAGDEKDLNDFLSSLNEESFMPSRRLKWRGVVVFAFPLRDLEYETTLLKTLGGWQRNGEEVLLGISRAGDELIANEILHVDVVAELNKHVQGWTSDSNSRCACDKKEDGVKYIPPDYCTPLPNGVGLYCIFDQAKLVGCEVAAWENAGHEVLFDKSRIDTAQIIEWNAKVKPGANNPWPAWKGIVVDEINADEFERGMNWDEAFFARLRDKPDYRKQVAKTIADSIIELYEMLTTKTKQ